MNRKVSNFQPSFTNEETCLIPDDIPDYGFCFNDVYIPEEILTFILSHVPPTELLKCSQVCRKWFNLVRSYSLWSIIYKRKYNRKAEKRPWYLYYSLLSTDFFDTNLVVNGNGQNKFNHWKIIENGGDRFRIEDPPTGADPLPLDIPEFSGKTGCFATSYQTCAKQQKILIESKLMKFILSKYRPHIYVSEWVAGRFDCGSRYKLRCAFMGDDNRNALYEEEVTFQVAQWHGSPWSKIEKVIKDYPDGVKAIVFEHAGQDTQFWKGHYGSKMAGGVLKILFDSIKPIEDEAVHDADSVLS